MAENELRRSKAKVALNLILTILLFPLILFYVTCWAVVLRSLGVEVKGIYTSQFKNIWEHIVYLFS